MSEQAVDRVEYVPTTEEIREYVEIGGEQRPWEEPTPEKDAARAAAFDRWLAAHDAEVLAVRSEALDTLQRIADRLGTSRLGTLYGLAAEMNEALLHITPDAPAPSDAASEREALATIAERDEAAVELFARKEARARAVASVGGTPVFPDRAAARRAAETILRRNRIIWSTVGPDADDGSLPATEEAQRWSKHVLADIVPGNELLVAMVRMNPALATDAERDTAEMLSLHTADLRAKHSGQAITAPARRFPTEAADLFSEGRHE